MTDTINDCDEVEPDVQQRADTLMATMRVIVTNIEGVAGPQAARDYLCGVIRRMTRCPGCERMEVALGGWLGSVDADRLLRHIESYAIDAMDRGGYFDT